jgi:hypothetical protein
MTTKAHGSLSLCLLSTTSLILYYGSLELISFLHGPSSQASALKQRDTDTTLVALAEQQRNGNGANDALCNSLYEVACAEDERALILREAGVIASLFTLLLAVFPKFFVHGTSYTRQQRLYFVAMVLPLLIIPSSIGQVVYLGRVPVEVSLMKTSSWGVGGGLASGGYCAMQSMLKGEGDGQDSLAKLLRECKVVGVAAVIVYLVLGRRSGS